MAVKKSILTALFTLLFILPLAISLPALEIGTIAPDFELPNLEGKKVRLADFKGQIVVLKLATTWCPTCKEQSEELRDAGAFLKEKNIPVIEIFLQDSDEMVRKYLKDENLQTTHVVLQDDGRVRKAYNVYLIPRILIIDRDSRIRRDGNMITAYDLKRNIGQIIEAK